MYDWRSSRNTWVYQKSRSWSGDFLLMEAFVCVCIYWFHLPKIIIITQCELVLIWLVHWQKMYRESLNIVPTPTSSFSGVQNGRSMYSQLNSHVNFFFLHLSGWAPNCLLVSLSPHSSPSGHGKLSLRLERCMRLWPTTSVSTNLLWSGPSTTSPISETPSFGSTTCMVRWICLTWVGRVPAVCTKQRQCGCQQLLKFTFHNMHWQFQVFAWSHFHIWQPLRL